MGYASATTDAVTYGLVGSAYGLNITQAQIQANLDAASAWADTCLRGRYKLPLLQPYDPALVRAVVHIARYEILALRGFDEENAADKNVVDSNTRAIEFLNAIQRQEKHLAAVESGSASPGIVNPTVTSSSTICFNTTRTAPNRGL